MGHGGAVREGMVYPRVCGGTETLGGGDVGIVGLSPRVRGNLLVSPNRRRKYWVYPRVCGGTQGIDRCQSVV